MSFYPDKDIKAEPFQTRDQNPFTFIYSQPNPASARLSRLNNFQTSISLTTTNTLNVENLINESIFVDYEAYILTVNTFYNLNDDWALMFSVPVIHYGGGTFDQAIDEFHKLFGLPRASRPSVPDNQFRIEYINNANQQINLLTSKSGIGDLVLGLGKQLFANKKDALNVWLYFSLPTGNEKNLTGSSDTNLSFLLAYENRLKKDWVWFYNLGVLFPSKSIFPDLQTANNVMFGYSGISWSVTPTIDLQIQFNAHTAYYPDSDIQFLSDTVLIVFGGTIRLDNESAIDISVSEDIEVGSSPDVSLLINWRNISGIN